MDDWAGNLYFLTVKQCVYLDCLKMELEDGKQELEACYMLTRRQETVHQTVCLHASQFTRKYDSRFEDFMEAPPNPFAVVPARPTQLHVTISISAAGKKMSTSKAFVFFHIEYGQDLKLINLEESGPEICAFLPVHGVTLKITAPPTSFWGNFKQVWEFFLSNF